MNKALLVFLIIAVAVFAQYGFYEDDVFGEEVFGEDETEVMGNSDLNARCGKGQVFYDYVCSSGKYVNGKCCTSKSCDHTVFLGCRDACDRILDKEEKVCYVNSKAYCTKDGYKLDGRSCTKVMDVVRAPVRNCPQDFEFYSVVCPSGYHANADLVTCEKYNRSGDLVDSKKASQWKCREICPDGNVARFLDNNGGICALPAKCDKPGTFPYPDGQGGSACARFIYYNAIKV